MAELKQWEQVAVDLARVKIEGGYIYQSDSGEGGMALTFAPDVDLQRYQAHLRDAYRQGYIDGQNDSKHGVTQEFEPL
jgi:hypothetical protein